MKNTYLIELLKMIKGAHFHVRKEIHDTKDSKIHHAYLTCYVDDIDKLKETIPKELGLLYHLIKEEIVEKSTFKIFGEPIEVEEYYADEQWNFMMQEHQII